MATKRLALELGLMQKRHIKNQMKPTATKAKQEFEYLVVLDFESTCWETGARVGQQEIIEFPAVLLDLLSGKIVSEFQQYVMPVEQPILSAFCRNLTGITQEQVEAGVPLGACLCLFSSWIRKMCKEHQISFNTNIPGKHATFATWSDWDLGVCLHHECLRKQFKKPEFFNQWADIRLLYKKFYQRCPKGLLGALQDLGISFEGREHSGICDTRNTAVLISRMVRDGCIITVTKSLTSKTAKVSTMKATAQNLFSQVKKAMFNLKNEEKNGNNKHKRKLGETHVDIETNKNGKDVCVPCKATCHSHRIATSEQGAVTVGEPDNVCMLCSSDKVNFELQLDDYAGNKVCDQLTLQESHHNTSLNSKGTRAMKVNDVVKKLRFTYKPSTTSKSFKVMSHPSCKMKNLVQNKINSNSFGCTWNTPKLLSYTKINTFKTPVTASKKANVSDSSVRTDVSEEKRSVHSNQKLELSELTLYKESNLNMRHYKKTPPLCNCGRRAKLLVASRPGPNQGRHFFSCPHGKSGTAKGCKFFKWEDEPYTKVSSFPDSYNTPVSNLNNLFVAQSLPHTKENRKSTLYRNQRTKSEPVKKKQNFTLTVPLYTNSRLPYETPGIADVGRSVGSRMTPYQITPYIVKTKSVGNR